MRILLTSVFFFLLGCSALEKDETLTWSVQKLYFEAKQNADGGSAKTARKYYNKLLARYPYGRYAQQANLDLIALEYKDKEYDKAVAQADKFIQLYPRSPYAEYARYMKGVIAYSRDISIIEKLFPTSIAQSDQSLMKKAFDNFGTLVAQNPDGEYSQDAKMRMRYLRNITAEHEIYVAEYYLRRGAFVAAANRGQYVLENYRSTPAVPLALGVMIRAYKELKMPKLAADSQRVLDQNFPNEAAKNPRLAFLLTGDISKKKSFLSKLSDTLLTN